jgi:hypothetical protein
MSMLLLPVVRLLPAVLPSAMLLAPVVLEIVPDSLQRYCRARWCWHRDKPSFFAETRLRPRFDG